MSHTRTISLVALSFIWVTMISGLILSSSLVSADDFVVDEINVSVPTACSLTGTGMNSHNATIPNGTSNSNSGTSTITAFCNDADGFAFDIFWQSGHSHQKYRGHDHCVGGREAWFA